jgi:hypothetical protein
VYNLAEVTDMVRKNPHYELPEEVVAVLDCSPNLEVCAEFRDADIYSFAKHLNEGTCQQCVEFSRQANRELRTMKLLADFRKRNVQ